MGDFSIPLQGIQRAVSGLDKAASRIARAGLPAPADSPPDVVDLSTEMVALMEAQNAVEANLAAAYTMDQVTKKTIDVLA